MVALLHQGFLTTMALKMEEVHSSHQTTITVETLALVLKILQGLKVETHSQKHRSRVVLQTLTVLIKKTVQDMEMGLGVMATQIIKEDFLDSSQMDQLTTMAFPQADQMVLTQ